MNENSITKQGVGSGSGTVPSPGAGYGFIINMWILITVTKEDGQVF